MTMWISKTNPDYAASHVGIRMRFFYKQRLQSELEVRKNSTARKLLEDWARLRISPEQVQQYQRLTCNYVGATVDDVTIGQDGEYYINGKSVETI